MSESRGPALEVTCWKCLGTKGYRCEVCGDRGKMLTEFGRSVLDLVRENLGANLGHNESVVFPLVLLSPEHKAGGEG